jgi:hypothetical protein
MKSKKKKKAVAFKVSLDSGGRREREVQKQIWTLRNIPSLAAFRG